MSAPSSSTCPASAADGTSSCIRLRIRRNVDLPHPEGPISAVMPPAGMVSETRSSTLWLPNQAVMSTPRSSASPVSGSDGAGAVVVMVGLPWWATGARATYAARATGQGWDEPSSALGLQHLDRELGAAGVAVGV